MPKACQIGHCTAELSAETGWQPADVPKWQAMQPQQPTTQDCSSSSTSKPVSIPEPKVLPYSRLSLKTNSFSSISPSQRILSGSPSQDFGTLQGPAQQQYGLQPLNPTPQATPLQPSRPQAGDGSAAAGAAGQQQNRRPPLPPSPPAGRAVLGAAGSFSSRSAAAWINPGDATGSGSGSGGKPGRVLSAAAAAGSYSEPGLLLSSAGAGSSSSSLGYRQHSLTQAQQQAYYGSSPGSASMSPGGGEGVLAAAVMSEDVAAAAGNPYHPQHDSAMQLLLDHQALQLQQLQARDQHLSGGGSGSSGRVGYLRGSSFSNTAGLSPRSGGRASPHMSPRAPSRSSSFNRLSELGTSPGLIEASFMGMAARCSSQHSVSVASSRSASLQHMMQQQQAAIRAQQLEQQRSLTHSRSVASFEEWNGSQQGPGSGQGSLAGSRPGSAASRTQQPAGSAAAAGAYGTFPTPGASQPEALDWEDAQQQLLGSSVATSLPAVGHGRGIRALPGRPGLHWLSRADEGESAARGLLGLPRPGFRNQQGSSRQGAVPPRPQQQQQPAGHQEGPNCSSQGSGSDQAGSDVSLGTPGAAAASQPTPQRIQYDPGVFAAYAAAVGGPPNALRSSSASSGSPLAAAAQRALFGSRSFGRQGSSSLKDRAAAAGASDLLLQRSMSRSGSCLGMPTCLICLDQLTPGDFESGEAMYLACRCKGEVALRHRQCAEKWSRIKGNTICDVCKAPILNLPEVPPLPAPPTPRDPLADDRLLFQGAGLWGPLGDEPPAVADHVFDCIRVTWVVLIVCILFFETSVTQAFVTGALVGSAYVALSASLASCRRWRRQRQQQPDDAGAGAGGGWHADALHAPLLGGTRAPLLPV